jgi:hypothetical protein
MGTILMILSLTGKQKKKMNPLHYLTLGFYISGARLIPPNWALFLINSSATSRERARA